MDWKEIVSAEIHRHKMLRFGPRIAAAVSGGADSVFLLNALIELGLATAVIHINHKLRGEDSDRDEAFVRQLAQNKNLPFHSATLPPNAGNREQEARKSRYTFFADCRQQNLCDAIATGHTLDDQAETVLSRFLRGAGTAGLSGIRPVTNAAIIRPLLKLRRDHIRQFLTAQSLSWKEDCTNSDTGLQRNRIRLETMPLLAGHNPALAHVLASTAEWADGEEDYWAAEIAEVEADLFIQNGEVVLLRTGDLHNFPTAVQRRLIRRAIELAKGSLRGIDFQHVESIRAMTETREGSGRLQIPGMDAYRSFDWLRLAPPGFDTRLERNFEAPLTAPGSARIPARNLIISLEPMQMELVGIPRVYNKQVNMLDGEQCSGTLTLRNWQPGDSYLPAGKTSEEKIKTLFQENRIPLWERRNWPVIEKDGSILWARRFGAALSAAPRPDSKSVFEVRDSGESIRTLATSEVM